MSEAQEAPSVTGRMFLYEQPELLMKENHGDLGLQAPAQPFAFAAKARAIPITLSEVPTAMKDYPLIFMSKEQPQLLAITGLYDDVNLFVDESGNWDDYRYIPGYLRRYPFGIAAEADGQRMAIVIDRAYEGLVKAGERPLFDNGEMTQQTKDAVEFVKGYERDRALTEQFAGLLNEHELIQSQSAHYTPTGAPEPVTFAQYFGIDEDRLKALSDDKILDLQKKGLLALVYALLMSMGNWRILLNRRAKRFNLKEQDVFRPMVSQ
jgi:hypothetical protein